MAKSRSETESMEFSVGFLKPSLGGALAVHRIGGGSQGAGPRGHSSIRSRQSSRRGDIPADHVGIGHHVVGEGGGLGPLQVGVAGHHRFGLASALDDEHLSRSSSMLDDFGDLTLM